MNSSKVIIFMGPPGSGKGSLSRLCVESFKWQQLSTGDLCRKHISEGSEIGKQIDFSIKSGKLISDELIAAMVEQWLQEQLFECEGMILDGFPRTVVQAEFLQKFLLTASKRLQLNLFKLCVSDGEVVRRLRERYICSSKACQAVYSYRQGSVLMPRVIGICDRCSGNLVQRSDDNLESIQHRLDAYHLFTQDLLSFYKEQGYGVNELDGEQPIDKVFENFKALIG